MKVETVYDFVYSFVVIVIIISLVKILVNTSTLSVALKYCLIKDMRSHIIRSGRGDDVHNDKSNEYGL